MNSRQGDQSPIETGVDLVTGPRPPAASSYYRFQEDFWDRADFSLEALPDNRLGHLDEEQAHLIFDLFRRPGEWFLILYTAGLLSASVMGAISHPSLGTSIFVGAWVLAILAIFAFGIWGLSKDSDSGRVESVCGELTKWEDWDPEGPDLYGLKLGSFSVDLPSEAYAALPKTGHYRIYFTPIRHKVVNAEEHSDDAPHEVPSRASRAQAEAEHSVAYSLVDVPIEDLGLRVRTLDRLKANEITNVGQLGSGQAKDLLGVVGRDSFDEIIERLVQRRILTPEMVTKVLHGRPL